MKIYTSYFANLRKIPDNIIPISICRKSPKWYNGLEYKGLAPSQSLLSAWQREPNEKAYREVFNNLLKHLNIQAILFDLSNMSNGKDIVLVCYEHPSKFCHRHLVAKWLNDIFGIGGDNMNTNYSDMYKKGSLFGMNGLRIKNVIFNEPATVVYWDDGDKTVVKCGKGEQCDPEKGLAMAISKKALGNRGNYFNEFKKWLPKESTDATEYISLKDFAESKNLKADSVRKAIKAGAYPEAKKIKGKWYLPSTLGKEG